LSRGWTWLDEYVEPGRTARNTDRPALRAMLDRVREHRDADIVVMHKFDRFARNAGDHLTMKAALLHLGVRLVSVVEPIEDNATGKMIEGLLAVLNEHYSDNLSAEVRKGMGQKAKNGGWPHRAPVGYLNRRLRISGVDAATVEVDLERGPLVAMAFELYATGDYSVDALADELRVRGLTTRPHAGGEARPLSRAGVHHLLTNPFYIGIVQWDGVEHAGAHVPLVSRDTWHRAQSFCAAAPSGIRRRVHDHYLKGVLFCGACGRRLSIQVSNRRYHYFFCLGARDRQRPTGCTARFMPTEVLEQGVERLYDRLQLRPAVAGELSAALDKEVAERSARSQHDSERYRQRLTMLDDQRRKLLEAYYAGAIDLTLLRSEQARIGTEHHEAEQRLRAVDASPADWRDAIERALLFATESAPTYRKASDRGRRLLNRTVFERVLVRDGQVSHAEYRPPFGVLLPTGRASLTEERAAETAWARACLAVAMTGDVAYV
jgi:DNA invertase Pin-like site-specific DNA recombinase